MQKHAKLIAVSVALLCPVTTSTISSAQERLQSKDTVSSRMKSLGGTFPLSQVGTCKGDSAHYSAHGVEIKSYGATLNLQGPETNGGAWKAKLPINGLGCAIYSADLDNNGQSDLIIQTPSIGDRGAYGSTLSILLFDNSGTPFPWQAVGRFTVEDGSIQELRRDAEGVFIIQTMETGLPAWDGVSFVSYAYRVADTRIKSVSETIDGIAFPHVVSASKPEAGVSQRVSQMVSAEDLSTLSISSGVISPVTNSDPVLIGLGGVIPPSSANEAVSERASASPTRLSDPSQELDLANGTAIMLPDILVVDDKAGNRQVTFHPENTDLKGIIKGSYRVHSSGLSCSGPEDCEPFTLWVK